MGPGSTPTVVDWSTGPSTVSRCVLRIPPTEKRTVTHSLTRLAPILALAVLLAACGGARLSVSAEPQPSEIAITDQAGKAVELKREGERLVARVDFATKGPYTVKVTPLEEASETHHPTEITLTQGDFDSLPPIGSPEDNFRQLAVALNQKDYENLGLVEVFVAKDGSWAGWITQARAYTSVSEEGGAVPGRIMDFGPEISIQGMDISPDGSRILFANAEFRPVRNATGLESRYLVDIKSCNISGVAIQGGGRQQVTSGNYRDMYPAFAFDGESLIFSSNRRRPQHADLLLINAGGSSGISNVYIDSRTLLALYPSQAIDETIAFSLVDPAGRDVPQIWTIGGSAQFPTEIVKGIQGRISPDGKRIAYIGADGNLWVIGVDGTNETQLTYEAPRIRETYLASLSSREKVAFELAEEIGVKVLWPYANPSWSPDGKRILFASMESNDGTGRPNQDIWIMGYDGTGKLQLTTNGSADRYPLMSPDKRDIYFLSNRGKRWSIYRISAPN